MKTVKKYTKTQVAQHNDAFRMSFISTSRHRIAMTSTVSESKDKEEIIKQVRAFGLPGFPQYKFNKGNDPYGQHDFGKIVVEGQSYFWKIDYYDENWEYGVDPQEETPYRLLTIMRADEY